MISDNRYKDFKNMVLKGTTTIGIVCNGGVVFATDTRAVMGYFVAHKNVKKIYRLDNHLAITIAGVVADAQNVVEILRANASLYRLNRGIPMPVSAISRLAGNILFNSRGSPLLLQALIGGIDDSGVHVFSVDPFGSVTEEMYVSTGSGSPIAYGILEDAYRKNMDIDEGVDLVIRAVNSAMKRDTASGNSFNVVIVGKEGYRELTDAEKKALT